MNIFRFASKLFTKNSENLFTKIYNKKSWGDFGTLSGPGSTLKETQVIRQAVPQILKKYRKKINTKNSTKKSGDLFINNFNNKSMFSNDTSNDTSKSNNNMLEISNKDFDKYKSMFS